jgi:hypothetical protein
MSWCEQAYSGGEIGRELCLIDQDEIHGDSAASVVLPVLCTQCITSCIICGL